MSGSTGVGRPDASGIGHPGASSRAPVHATATWAAVTAPMTDPSPKRLAIASRATPTAASTSPHPDPVALGIDTSTPAATATATNQCRTTCARPVITRSHPRTVPTGIPNRAPITRCPTPTALATTAAQISSTAYPLRSNNVTGNNTCVTAHPRHRDRRGRTGSAIPTTRRARAKPHRTNTPSGHDGHDTSPPASRDSTRSESTSTVTISAFRTTHGAPEISARKFSGGAVHPSVPRHTDGADHQHQTQSQPGHHIGTLTDGSQPCGRHTERRSTPVSGDSPRSTSWRSWPPTTPPPTARRVPCCAGRACTPATSWQWRRARDAGALAALAAPRGRKRRDPHAERIARLEAEKQRLEQELAKARFVVDVQAKLHALLETLSESADTEPRSTP